MDGSGQAIINASLDTFNLLSINPQESLFKCDFGFDDGFGFDPSPTEQAMLGQYPATDDLLSASTYQLPFQLSPTSLLLQTSDQVPASIGQNHMCHPLSHVSGISGASAHLQYEEVSFPELGLV